MRLIETSEAPGVINLVFLNSIISLKKNIEKYSLAIARCFLMVSLLYVSAKGTYQP